MNVPDWLQDPRALAEVVGGAVCWVFPNPRACWTALRLWLTLRGFPMNLSNPVALMGAALKLGQDGVKLYTDITTNNKTDAIAATLDALPAFATVTGEPLADIQAVVTVANLGYVWDLEQDLVGVLPLLQAALAKYRAT